MPDINTFSQVGDVEGAITSTNPLDVRDAGVGLKADAAVVNPASDATTIALLKGILTQQLAIKSDIATLKADVAIVKGVIGTVGDAAWSGTGDATVIAALKAAKTA
jgi:hypothetical protein